MIEHLYSPISLPLTLIVAFFGAALPLIAERLGRNVTTVVAGAVMALCLGLLVPFFPHAIHGHSVIYHIEWLPIFGLNLAMRFDGLGMLFSLLILGIGMLVVLYARYYLPEDDKLGRFYALLLLFMSAMLGIVLSENLLMMVVFWEVTSLSSFLLIAYKSESHESRIGARMALVVTGAGGLALLAGILLLGHVVGSYELTAVISAAGQIKSNALYPVILGLVLLGAFTKSAQFPFQFWLPNAMVAPTPVSAYLHSATMVKAGVFLLARMYPVLGDTPAWIFSVSITGAITLIYGAYLAMYRHDFKGLLAYSTISHLGLITLLFGMSTPMSVVAGVFHIINHAIFKASLFMSAGIIDHECGSRDMRRVHGLFKFMPITATLAMLAASSMAGVPLLNGFLSKEMFFAEAIDFHGFGMTSLVFPIIATIAGILAVAYSLRFIHDVFFNGQPIDLPRQPHEPPRLMRVPVEILVVLCLLVGLFPAWSVDWVLSAAAGASLQGPLPVYELKLWHGFNAALFMSLVALAGGGIVYAMRHTLTRWNAQLPTVNSRTAFERAYQNLAEFAERVVVNVDNGSLQRYIALFFTFVFIYAGWAFVSGGSHVNTVSATAMDIASMVALLMLAVGALGATFMHHRRLLAIILIGIVGLVVVLVFVRFSAPDLALTQLTVEVVTIVLMLLALHYLPQHTPKETANARIVRDIILALGIGFGMGIISLALLNSSFSTISDFYLQQSVSGGGGSNVVNVILVDFRGFDTLGEISVLAMAALGAHALLSQLYLAQRSRDIAGRQWAEDAHPIFLKMLMRPLLPLALTVAVYIFLRGHNLPGGGFVAGLVTGVALILQSLAGGFSFADSRLPKSYPQLLGLGLALAAGIGLLSWLFMHPFLTSTHGHVTLPILGGIELASVIVFDLGVYVVVVATVLLILTELARLNKRGDKV